LRPGTARPRCYSDDDYSFAAKDAKDAKELQFEMYEKYMNKNNEQNFLPASPVMILLFLCVLRGEALP
jgi:hypothetical protein